CLGRGLRTATGKSRCKIFDHSGTVHRLGFPCSIEYDELLSDDDGMNSAKAARREKEKKAKEPKECKKCRFMKPAGVYVCPKCGFKPVGGENVEVDESRQLTQLNGVQKQATMADKQLWYSMMTHYAISKGYKSGWAYHKYIERFGTKPSNQLKQVGKQPSPEFMAWIRHLNIKRAKSSAR
ncbi:hypothetical protein, partial [Shewanella sp.]|uniref:hypothetical protein n=1 Tax=Shewanella sp. TaxID=50422 RepID=UPI003F32B1EE